jgi:hypothetical protein
MKRVSLPFLLLTVFLLPSVSLLNAQDAWRVIPTETPSDHKPLPFLKAVGIPATAIYKGEKRKAFVIICGSLKEERHGLPADVHLGPPEIEIHIDGLDQMIPEKLLDLFDGPDTSDASTEIRVFAISIARGKQVFRAMSSVDRYEGHYPESIVGPEGNNVLGTGTPLKGPRQAAWMQFLHEMSSGFDQGQILIGGKELSPNIEIDFSGNGIKPLLQEMLRVVAP